MEVGQVGTAARARRATLQQIEKQPCPLNGCNAGPMRLRAGAGSTPLWCHGAETLNLFLHYTD